MKSRFALFEACAVVDCILTLVFFRPYRRVLLRFLGLIWRKIFKKGNVVKVRPVHPVKKFC